MIGLSCLHDAIRESVRNSIASNLRIVDGSSFQIVFSPVDKPWLLNMKRLKGYGRVTQDFPAPFNHFITDVEVLAEFMAFITDAFNR